MRVRSGADAEPRSNTRGPAQYDLFLLCVCQFPAPTGKARGELAVTEPTESGGSKLSPPCRAYLASQKMVNRWGSNLGLDPDSRSRLNVWRSMEMLERFTQLQATM